MEDIRDRISTLAIQLVSPRNFAWKLANRSNPAEGDLEKWFARLKQMNGC